MHVNTHKLTFLGALLALAVVLQLLGSYVEASTLFFLAASSFCLGIAIYEAGLRLGLGFLIAALALAFLMSPNKFYCLTYGGFCIYIYILELLRVKTSLANHRIGLWMFKFVFYNLCFVDQVLIFFKDFLFSKDSGIIHWTPVLYVSVIAAAQIFLLIFDWAYRRFVPDYWLYLKKRLRLDR